MGKITVSECMCDGEVIEGLKVIEPQVFGDERGYFTETYNYRDFCEAGIDMEFVQDNQSASKGGVLRGLHFQIRHPQDTAHARIYDRLLEMCVPISCIGVSFRKETAQEKLERLKASIG